MKTNFPFKRLDLGDKFSHGGLTYRKISDKKAVPLTESGRGLTHSPVVFARSTDVVLVDPAKYASISRVRRAAKKVLTTHAEVFERLANA